MCEEFFINVEILEDFTEDEPPSQSVSDRKLDSRYLFKNIHY